MVAATTHEPTRTCVGCRTAAPRAQLLRVVASTDGDLVVDSRARMPGRGAWIHPDPACVSLAERRRAFGRALRLSGSPDVAPVREHLAAQAASAPDAPPAPTTGPSSTKAGRKPMGTR